MTGTDVGRFTYKSFPDIFEPPCTSGTAVWRPYKTVASGTKKRPAEYRVTDINQYLFVTTISCKTNLVFNASAISAPHFLAHPTNVRSVTNIGACYMVRWIQSKNHNYKIWLNDGVY